MQDVFFADSARHEQETEDEALGSEEDCEGQQERQLPVRLCAAVSDYLL